MTYIPNSHKKYNLLPICILNDVEMIITDISLRNKIEKIVNKTKGMRLHPYCRFKTYQDYFNELEDLINQFPNYKVDILEYKNSIVKMNNKDLWAIVKYIGESNFSFTKDKYYYVVMYLENNSWIIEGIIDNEEYDAFQVWLPGNTNPINLNTDFEIVIDPSNCLNEEFKNIMSSINT